MSSCYTREGREPMRIPTDCPYGEWISVKAHGTPWHSEWVIGFCYVSKCAWPVYYRDGDWYEHGTNLVVTEYITHWMPRPSPIGLKD